MKKFLLFVLVMQLSGCFMYNNMKSGLKCSFNSDECVNEDAENAQKEKDAEYTRMEKEAENLIKDRCIKELKYKFGTIDYMHCYDAYMNTYEYDRKMYDIPTAYFYLILEVDNQKLRCSKYGIKENSKDFNQCIEEQHASYVKQRLNDITAEQRRLEIQRNMLMQQMNNNINCQTYSIGSTVYTNCH